MSAAPDGTAYAVVASERYDGVTIGPGELDLVLAADEGAIVALDPDGHFMRSVTYGFTTFGDYRVAVLGDGGHLFYGLSGGGRVLAKGTPKETAITTNSFFARFFSDLSVDGAHAVRRRRGVLLHDHRALPGRLQHRLRLPAGRRHRSPSARASLTRPR